MYGNELPADQIVALEPGDTVTIETFSDTWSRSQIFTGAVTKLTAKQVVVHYAVARGTVEARFRKEDGQRIGSGRGALLDPMHPSTIAAVAKHRTAKRQQAIDGLAGRWSRERENIDLLRRLHTAVGEYLDAEAAS